MKKRNSRRYREGSIGIEMEVNKYYLNVKENFRVFYIFKKKEDG